MRQCPENGVKNLIQPLANVLGQESWREAAVFLQERVLSPITAVAIGLQGLGTVQFNRHPRVGAGKIHFHHFLAV